MLLLPSYLRGGVAKPESSVLAPPAYARSVTHHDPGEGMPPDERDRDHELAHVAALELALLDPRVRRAPDVVEALLDPDFVEVGASGRRFDARSMAAALAAQELAQRPLRARGLEAAWVGDGAVLVTYDIETRGRTALRSSLWRFRGGEWRLRFHQGTPVAP